MNNIEEDWLWLCGIDLAKEAEWREIIRVSSEAAMELQEYNPIVISTPFIDGDITGFRIQTIYP